MYPSGYTITLQRIIRLWSNFVYRTVLLISQSREEDEIDWSTHLPELYQKMWLFLMAYSMEFLTKHKCFWIERKVSVLVELQKFYLWFKYQPSLSFLGERYRSHSFSWKSSKFGKNKKNRKICGLEFFFILYDQKWIPNIYFCSSFLQYT